MKPQSRDAWYLSCCLVWLVMATDREDAHDVDKEEDVVRLNSSSLGSTHTYGHIKDVKERGSMPPVQDW